MAQVNTDLRQRIDLALERLIQAWEELPRASGEIERWDLVEQIDYVEEWTPKEELRSRLDAWAADGLLSSSQQVRYARLQELVRSGQPILARLRDS